jgi:outer membrane protein TolC
MKRKSRFLPVFFLLLLLQNISLAKDTTSILNKDQFLAIVRTYHPVVKQAELQVNRSAAGVLAARGAFDPKIETGIDRKTVDDKLYYSYFNTNLTIPTWYGVDIKVGFEEVIGERVTSEATLGKTSYLGVRLQPGNLIFDSRRAVLRQAQSFRQLSEAERQLIINDLLYDALVTYWNWVREYFNYTVVSEAVKVNEDRLKYVRLEYELGSRPAIDTVEALTQLQSFFTQQNNAWMSFQNAGLELSNYLWLDNNIPMNWQSNILPSKAELYQENHLPVLEQLILTARNDHPKLQSLIFKTDILQTDRRLKAQYLLPKLSLKANVINKGYSVPNNFTVPFLENNHKLGVDFSIPLLMREARGNFRSAKIKIQEIALEQDLTTLQIENKIKNYYNEVLQLGKQISLYEQALSNYQKLFQGEKIKFDAGESTLFLLNSRENKVLEASQKLYELRTKCNKSHAALMWAAGLFK